MNIKQIVKVLQVKFCKHEIDIFNIHFTNIPDIKKPTSNDYTEWRKYFREYRESEGYNKRVYGICTKCGEKFFGHCGLDIIKNFSGKRKVL